MKYFYDTATENDYFICKDILRKYTPIKDLVAFMPDYAVLPNTTYETGTYLLDNKIPVISCINIM